jgi:hypothetical protein
MRRLRKIRLLRSEIRILRVSVLKGLHISRRKLSILLRFGLIRRAFRMRISILIRCIMKLFRNDREIWLFNIYIDRKIS